MAIAAKVSSVELSDQMSDRFVGNSFEARLINAPGVSYQPGITVDSEFLNFEVTLGEGGYERQVITYSPADVSAYTDDGVALATKATVFAQDGSATSFTFSHAVLVWSSGNVSVLGDVTNKPTSGVNGTYTNIPVDSTTGSGLGLTVDLTVINAGASLSDWGLSINASGYGYEADDGIIFNEATLAGLGIIPPAAGILATTVSTVVSSANSGQILSVAQTPASVILSGGNEAVFYWNLKNFGFYSVTP